MSVACSTYGGEQKRVQSFGGETWGKRPLGRPRRRWEDNIKMNLQEVRCGERHDMYILEYFDLRRTR